MINRRRFLQASAGAAAFLAARRSAYAFSQSMPLQKFIQPLRGVSSIPVALPDTTAAGVDHYSIEIAQYTDQLHPSLPATKLWGYADAAHGGLHRHLGGIIVAQRGRPVQLTFTNNLPSTHILPVDTS